MFFKIVVIISVREGEYWTICGDINITEKEGVIMSPLFPKPYPANVRCEWLFTMDPGMTLYLRYV